MPLYRHLRDRLYLPLSLWVTYAVTYFLAGILMNQVGQWLEIARFTYWWQVITVYLLYMIPLSVMFHRLPWWQHFPLLNALVNGLHARLFRSWPLEAASRPAWRPGSPIQGR